jgi:hypothetical protein
VAPVVGWPPEDSVGVVVVLLLARGAAVVFCLRCTTTVGASVGASATAGAGVLGCGVVEGVDVVEVLDGC